MVAVTGATGFVGMRLAQRLAPAARVRAMVRSVSPSLPAAVEQVVTGDLDGHADWRPALDGVDTVIHLAARVHVMHDQAHDPLAAFRRVNVAATLALARQSAAAGVKRFVYLSSAKVNGEAGRYAETDPPAPVDPYAISKYEAEEGLRESSARSGLEVAIIRSPLVYGPGVKANFRALMRLTASGVPLPFGAVDNRRSLVAVDNLVDFIVACAEVPAAANETFFVSDDEDLSTPELIRRLARAMDRPARLIPVPVSWLWAGAAILGQQAGARRLLGSLQLDVSKSHRMLHWAPPVTVDEGLRRAVAPRA